MSIDVEAAVLGAIILDPGRIHDAMDCLKPAVFSHAPYRSLYRAMLMTARRGDPIDVLLLAEELKKTEHYEAIGGVKGIAALSDWAVSPQHIESYCKAALASERKRNVQKILKGAVSDVARSDIDDFCNALIAEIDKTSTGDHSRIITMKEAMVENREGTCSTMISTGYARLDRLMGGGIEPGRFYVLAAGTGTGKSDFVLNLAYQMTKEGKPAKGLLISMEMMPGEIEDRLVGICSGMPKGAAKALRRNTAGKDTIDKWQPDYVSAQSHVANMPLYIECSGDIDEGRFRAIVGKYYKTVDYIVFDYLQLVRPSHAGQKSFDRITEMSHTCKQLAMRYRIPVIALSQFSRDPAKDGRKPKISDLRGSGEIEQDADMIALLWRKQEREVSEEDLRIDIAKQRDGSTAILTYRYCMMNGQITDEGLFA